ncbi:Ras family protein [Trichuris suis]|nr:Ras family protein [Trichuris suis]
MPPRPQIERKIAIMGYRSVGKSSITLQFTENRFPDSYDPTIANSNLAVFRFRKCTHLDVAAFSKEFEFRGRSYQLHLFDTAGQDEYSLFPRSYSVGVHGFEVVKVIYDKILDSVGYTGDVSGSDYTGWQQSRIFREVSADEGRKTAEKWKASFLETTAKDNHRIRELFERLLFQVEKAHGNIRDTKESSCILS